MNAVDKCIGGHGQLEFFTDGMADACEARAKPDPLGLENVACVPSLAVFHTRRTIARLRRWPGPGRWYRPGFRASRLWTARQAKVDQPEQRPTV